MDIKKKQEISHSHFTISPPNYFQSRIMGSDVRFKRNDYLFYTTESNIISTFAARKSNIKWWKIFIYMWRTCADEKHIGTQHLSSSSHKSNVLDHRTTSRQSAVPIFTGPMEMHPKTVSAFEAQKLNEKYPVVVSRQFMIRVNVLMSLRNENVLGSKMLGHWWRIEFQKSSSP